MVMMRVEYHDICTSGLSFSPESFTELMPMSSDSTLNLFGLANSPFPSLSASPTPSLLSLFSLSQPKSPELACSSFLSLASTFFFHLPFIVNLHLPAVSASRFGRRDSSDFFSLFSSRRFSLPFPLLLFLQAPLLTSLSSLLSLVPVGWKVVCLIVDHINPKRRTKTRSLHQSSPSRLIFLHPSLVAPLNSTASRC